MLERFINISFFAPDDDEMLDENSKELQCRKKVQPRDRENHQGGPTATDCENGRVGGLFPWGFLFMMGAALDFLDSSSLVLRSAVSLFPLPLLEDSGLGSNVSLFLVAWS